MSSKKKVFAVAITTAALTVGTFGVAGAATKATRVSKTTVTSIANQAASGKLGHGEELSALLSALVTKGTITQAQADAIIAAHAAAEAARPPMGPKGDKASMDARLKVIATTLGRLLQLSQVQRRMHLSQHLLQMRQSALMQLSLQEH